MIENIQEMGPFGLYGILMVVIIAIFGLKNGYLLFIKKPKENLAKLGRSINAMLFWGAILLIISFLGTFLSTQVAIESVLHPNGDIRVMFGGIYNILSLVIFGLTSFTIISIVWYIFTGQHRRLLELSMKEKYTVE